MDSMGGKDVFSTNGAVIISMHQKKKPTLALILHQYYYYRPILLSIINSVLLTHSTDAAYIR